MKITHINPDSMLKNPAFSQAVMVEDAKKIVYIGEQNGVDASGVVVGDDLESQTEQDIRAGYAATQRAWGAHPIAITVHIVDGFAMPGALVGIEAVCALGA
jgi:2-iminobutanoate/2-iminopropanoate deaminase